jgi:rhodanese-related sulfurtransferase
MLEPEALAQELRAADLPVIFAGTSEEFARGHLPGSHWLPRGWLEPRIADFANPPTRVVVTAPDTADALLAGLALVGLGYATVVLDGGTRAWSAAGLPLENGLTGVTVIPNDVLPIQRSYAEMHNYLRWEEALGQKYE